MHFEILVEDASGELLLNALLPKILGENGTSNTWRTHPYKGIGRVPKDLKGKTDPSKRILLDRLPKLMAGYGKSLGSDSAVIVVVDLDDRDCLGFKKELLQILNRCRPKPRAMFRFAIEEMEAWLLGDRKAVLKEFPRAKVQVLDSYVQDSICGTWETLADAVFQGGSNALKAEGWPRMGQEKCRWASQIGRHLNVESNLSPSLQTFRNGVLEMSAGRV